MLNAKQMLSKTQQANQESLAHRNAVHEAFVEKYVDEFPQLVASKIADAAEAGRDRCSFLHGLGVNQRSWLSNQGSEMGLGTEISDAYVSYMVNKDKRVVDCVQSVIDELEEAGYSLSCKTYHPHKPSVPMDVTARNALQHALVVSWAHPKEVS